jgi:hypothetical protein
MYVIAIAKLEATVDAEAPALAADLGVTAYDARLLLATGTPIVVRSTPDRAQALELVTRIKARGHAAVAFDGDAVVSSAAMVLAKRPEIDGDALALTGRPERLPFDDVLALVAAVHKRRTETSSVKTEQVFSAGRGLASGGVLLTKSVTTTSRTSTEGRERVLYMFRRSGETPWILHEYGTTWTGFKGLALARSEAENFRAAVAALRQLAPGATYDERLLTRKATPEHVAMAGTTAKGTVHTSSEGGVDLLAHVIAGWMRGQEQPG